MFSQLRMKAYNNIIKTKTNYQFEIYVIITPNNNNNNNNIFFSTVLDSNLGIHSFEEYIKKIKETLKATLAPFFLSKKSTKGEI